jgi:hypothetical protein
MPFLSISAIAAFRATFRAFVCGVTSNSEGIRTAAASQNQMNPLAGRPKAVDAEQQPPPPPSVVAVPAASGGRARRRPLSATTGAGRQYALRQRVKGPLIRCQEFIERAASTGATDEFDDAAATLRTMLLDAVDAIADPFEPSSLSAASDQRSADHSAVLFDLSGGATADPGAFSPPRLSQVPPRTAHRQGTTTLLHVAVRHGCVRPDLVEELVSLGAAARQRRRPVHLLAAPRHAQRAGGTLRRVPRRHRAHAALAVRRRAA